MKTKNRNILLFVLGFIIMIGLTQSTIINNGDGTVTISYTLSSSTAIEMRNAMCYNYDYYNMSFDENNNLIPNPESCQDFADRKIKEFIRDNIKAYRLSLAQEEAKENVEVMINPIIN